MKTFLMAAAALSLLAPTLASAQGYDHGQDQRQDRSHDQRQGDGRGQAHAGWGQEYGGGHDFQRGERMGYNDWNGAQRVDYRQHNLRRPPYGYEWREYNGRYILAAVATGLIISAIVNSGR
jgi:Ni/Co efflux regulator RcnB